MQRLAGLLEVSDEHGVSVPVCHLYLIVKYVGNHRCKGSTAWFEVPGLNKGGVILNCKSMCESISAVPNTGLCTMYTNHIK